MKATTGTYPARLKGSPCDTTADKQQSPKPDFRISRARTYLHPPTPAIVFTSAELAIFRDMYSLTALSFPLSQGITTIQLPGYRQRLTSDSPLNLKIIGCNPIVLSLTKELGEIQEMRKRERTSRDKLILPRARAIVSFSTAQSQVR